MPQAQLNRNELRRLSIGNQHSDELSVIEWQVVKGAAVIYGIRDWTVKVDPTLTYEENVNLLKRQSVTEHGGATMREMRPMLQLQHMER